MKNVKQKRIYRLKTIEGRLKRLRTNEIDYLNKGSDSGKKRAEGGKTNATWKGKPTNILKRKHRLKSLRKETKTSHE